jgi:hypothetical protein
MGTSVVANAMASHDEINTESAFLQARSTAQVTLVEQSFFGQLNMESVKNPNQTGSIITSRQFSQHSRV